MSTGSVVCPNCRSSLRLLQTLHAGTRLNCPKCKTTFPMPAMPPTAVPVEAITVSRGPVVPPVPQALPVPESAAISNNPMPPMAVPVSGNPVAVAPSETGFLQQSAKQRARKIVAAWASVALVINLGMLATLWAISRPSSKPASQAVAQALSSNRTANHQEPAPHPGQTRPLPMPAPSPPAATAKTEQWLRQNLVDAYERSGQKNARWDSLARQALRLTVEHWSLRPDHQPHDTQIMVQMYDQLRAASCSDPLVLYAVGREYDDNAFPHEQVARDIEKSAYHPVWRCLALLRAARMHIDQPQQAFNELDRALKLLPEIAKDKSMPSAVWFAIGDQMIAAVQNRRVNGQPPNQWVYTEMNKVMPDGTVALTYKGRYYINWAWDARGTGGGNSVTKEASRLMDERLMVAQQSLEKAWSLDNSNSDAARSMISVELGQGQGLARMETWFKRAMDADPNNSAACSAKLYYLEPKWYGSENAMLDFGRECLKGGNWKAMIPFILVDAHAALAQYRPANGHYLQPGVWDDLKSVYEPYLQMNPQAVRERCQFAQLACRCNQWEQADKQFQILGDRVDSSIFPNRNEYARLKAEAAAKAKAGPKGL